MSKSVIECEFKILSDVMSIEELLEQLDVKTEIVSHENYHFKMKDGTTIKLRSNYSIETVLCKEADSYEFIKKSKLKKDSPVELKHEVSENISKEEFERHLKVLKSEGAKHVAYHAVKYRYHISKNVTIDVCDVIGIESYKGIDIPKYVEFEIKVKENEKITASKIIETLEKALGGKNKIKEECIDLENLYITERSIAALLIDYKKFLNNKGGKLKKELKNLK